MGHTFRPLRAVVHPLQVDQAPELARPGSLETFLAKFSRLAEYMHWDDTDRYYHLCASLNGIAGQVLWDVPKRL